MLLQIGSRAWKALIKNTKHFLLSLYVDEIHSPELEDTLELRLDIPLRPFGSDMLSGILIFCGVLNRKYYFISCINYKALL